MAKMKAVIRTYAERDREAVVAVWRAAGLVRSVNDPDRDIDRKLAIDPAGLLVAIDGERIVGTVMVGYEGHRGWINTLAVSPERRGGGIGRALVESAVELLRARGCPKVNLQVRRSNAEVIAFYEALGFRGDDVWSMGLWLVDDEAPPLTDGVQERHDAKPSR